MRKYVRKLRTEERPAVMLQVHLCRVCVGTRSLPTVSPCCQLADLSFSGVVWKVLVKAVSVSGVTCGRIKWHIKPRCKAAARMETSVGIRAHGCFHISKEEIMFSDLCLKSCCVCIVLLLECYLSVKHGKKKSDCTGNSLNLPKFMTAEICTVVCIL
ncbi:hypothetical protein XENOCAPTIV_027372 [Xenoophorus captivus]|uniref:Uncharacterized protein n=1 Tax=Xenoophorus captivus TaxID=1517983 RepID=A0ABV0QWT3_9TELE